MDAFELCGVQFLGRIVVVVHFDLHEGENPFNIHIIQIMQMTFDTASKAGKFQIGFVITNDCKRLAVDSFEQPFRVLT